MGMCTACTREAASASGCTRNRLCYCIAAARMFVHGRRSRCAPHAAPTHVPPPKASVRTHVKAAPLAPPGRHRQPLSPLPLPPLLTSRPLVACVAGLCLARHMCQSGGLKSASHPFNKVQDQLFAKKTNEDGCVVPTVTALLLPRSPPMLSSSMAAESTSGRAMPLASGRSARRLVQRGGSGQKRARHRQQPAQALAGTSASSWHTQASPRKGTRVRVLRYPGGLERRIVYPLVDEKESCEETCDTCYDITWAEDHPAQHPASYNDQLERGSLQQALEAAATTSYSDKVRWRTARCAQCWLRFTGLQGQVVTF